MRVSYHGITDEVDECGHCGKQGLKKAVMLFILDADGNRDELEYWGTTCAAQALNLRTAQVTRFAGEAERKRQARIAHLTLILGDMDPMGRFPHEVRRLWWKAVRHGRDLEVNGATYGPNESEGFQFLGYATAQVAAWTAELATLKG